MTEATFQDDKIGEVLLGNRGDQVGADELDGVLTLSAWARVNRYGRITRTYMRDD